MKFVDIKTSRVSLTNEDEFVLDGAIKVVEELLDHIDELDGKTIFKDPHYADADEYITVSEIEEALDRLKFIREIYGIDWNKKGL